MEIAAVAAPGLPDHEIVAPPAPGGAGAPEPDPADVGPIDLCRYRPSGSWAIVGASEAAGARGTGTGGPRRASAWRRSARIAAAPLLAARRWLLWPHAVRGWWTSLARQLAPADVYHACGSLTIAAALAARERDGTSRTGRSALVVYDAIDDVAGSNEMAAMPAFIRGRIGEREAAWARAADAVITVNDALADRLAARWKTRQRPLVVPNVPEPPTRPPSADRAADLREAAGLGPGTRIVLFQGRLGPGLGLEAAADAVLMVPDAALVLLGFGRGLTASHARDRDPRFAGRHVTLPAVHPDELLAWTAGADVALIPLPPLSANQRLSTPNKFWEALAVGTPVVVVSGLEVMERLVADLDLGAVARSPAPADLAAAIEAVLARIAIEGEAWRERIATTSLERFAWPAAATAYRSLIRGLAERRRAG